MNKYYYGVCILWTFLFMGCYNKKAPKDSALIPIISKDSTELGKKNTRVNNNRISEGYAIYLLEIFYSQLLSSSNSCKTMCTFFLLDDLEKLKNFYTEFKTNNPGFRDDELGLRFYFGRFPNDAEGKLRDKNTIIIVPTKKKGNSFIDVIKPKGDLLVLGTEQICPTDCKGALLLKKLSMANQNTLKACKSDFGSDLLIDTQDKSWGNISTADALKMISAFLNNKGEKSECATLAIHFEKKTITGMLDFIDTLNNLKKDHRVVTGIRIYFATYPSNAQRGLRNKNTILITITEAGDAAGTFHRDILSDTKDMVTSISPLNNGSRCPPGSNASLINELVQRGVMGENYSTCLDSKPEKKRKPKK